MRKILILLCVFFSFAASAQRLQTAGGFGYQFQRLAIDTLMGLPKDTFAVPSSLLNVPFIANKSGSIYTWNISTHVWNLFSSGGVSASLPDILGSILSQTSFPDLTGYTNTGSSAVIASNAVNFPTGINNYTQYLSYDYVTGLERFTATLKIKVNEKSATSNGFAFGVNSVNSVGSYQSDMICKFDMTNTANAGRLSLFTGNTPTKLDSTSSLLSFSAGDSIFFTVDRDLNEITISAYNKTTNSATVTLSYSIINSVVPFNTGKFTVWPLGGDFTLYSINIFSRQIKNANLMMLGDSKMGTYLLTDYSQRAVAKMNSYFSSTIANSGNGDKTAEILQITHEVIALNPKYVFLYIGSNDVRTGVPSATYLANIDTIVNRLTNAGIIVTHGLFYEPALTQTVLLAHLQINDSTHYIDTYTPIEKFLP